MQLDASTLFGMAGGWPENFSPATNNTLGKNACKIANMRYAYPAVIQVKISNIGYLDEVVGFILSKWRTTAINAIKNKTQHFGK